ncbi:hypothetical protein BJY52DRAFT_617113 [Lactarius psammicola]|nr:hypothetical protein BJY52DRAFT_617113 [Lactarius psammicola]
MGTSQTHIVLVTIMVRTTPITDAGCSTLTIRTVTICGMKAHDLQPRIWRVTPTPEMPDTCLSLLAHFTENTTLHQPTYVLSFFVIYISCVRCVRPCAPQDIQNGEVRDCPPSMPDVAGAFSRSVSEYAPLEISAMEGLKCLADRYLHDPGSQVNALRMGLSPSGGRLRVMVVVDIDTEWT